MAGIDPDGTAAAAATTAATTISRPTRIGRLRSSLRDFIITSSIASCMIAAFLTNKASMSNEQTQLNDQNSFLAPHLQSQSQRPLSHQERTSSAPNGNGNGNDGGGVTLKNTTRSKVHWCFWRPHMFTPMNILRDEFGYTEEVDPKAGDNWDLIFGGYPHCGDKRFDWKMETGLNKFLSEEQGWDKLQPHQVWFPCMGCKDSYCNKRDLCLLMKEIDPNYCFSLPDDHDRLLKNMRQSQEEAEGLSKPKQQFWVLKEDGPDKHLHVGNGVSFIKSERELPNKQDQSSGSYLVQPLVNHKMGVGIYQRRRHELRMYVCVTSTTPLRAYTYCVGEVCQCSD